MKKLAKNQIETATHLAEELAALHLLMALIRCDNNYRKLLTKKQLKRFEEVTSITEGYIWDTENTLYKQGLNDIYMAYHWRQENNILEFIDNYREQIKNKEYTK